jgi:hypothetical protein
VRASLRCIALCPRLALLCCRDQLLGFRVASKEVWSEMIKATDSASPQQRSDAYRVLIHSAVVSKQPQQLVKTLQHLVKKVKNESGACACSPCQPCRG